MGFNPADYKAVEDKAKVMTKPELEEYYVEVKDKRHLGPGDIIGIIWVILVISLLLFFIGYVGWGMGQDELESRVSDALVETSFEVCPTLGEGYSSEKFIDSSSLTDRIDCTKINFNP